MFKDLTSESESTEMQCYAHWKTTSISYSVEISTSPGSFMKLSEVNFVKNLGVWTSLTLKPSLQCNKVAANATKLLGLLKRTFQLFLKDLCIFFVQEFFGHWAFRKSTKISKWISMWAIKIALWVQIEGATVLIYPL